MDAGRFQPREVYVGGLCLAVDLILYGDGDDEQSACRTLLTSKYNGQFIYMPQLADSSPRKLRYENAGCVVTDFSRNVTMG